MTETFDKETEDRINDCKIGFEDCLDLIDKAEKLEDFIDNLND